MGKKLVVPKYEQLILDIAVMNAEQLETVIRCARKMLVDMKPRAPRKPKTVKPIQEKAS